jgi:hypothetical protein
MKNICWEGSFELFGRKFDHLGTVHHDSPLYWPVAVLMTSTDLAISIAISAFFSDQQRQCGFIPHILLQRVCDLGI